MNLQKEGCFIEIKVKNLWVNRLIGDAQPGATKIAFVSQSTYTADSPLVLSGFLGPVRLMQAVTAR